LEQKYIVLRQDNKDLLNKFNQLRLDYDDDIGGWNSTYKKLEQKYTALRQENKDLLNKSDRLRVRYDTDIEHWKGSYYSTKKDIAHLRKVINHHDEDRQYLQSKLDELEALHIRSVNSVGTGLEPITDKTFEGDFRNLQDKLGDWSRKIFKHKGEGHPTAAIDLTSAYRLPAKVNNVNQLKLTKLIEMAAWDFLEDTVLSRWLPWLGEDGQKSMNELRVAVQLGGMFPGPSFVYRI
jgi:hypothetical protein